MAQKVPFSHLLDCTPALFRRKHSAADVDLITHTDGRPNTHHPGSRETHKPDDIIIRCDEKRHRTKNTNAQLCAPRAEVRSPAKNATLFSTFPMFVPSLSW